MLKIKRTITINKKDEKGIRICMISEGRKFAIDSSPAEGVQKFSYCLAGELSKICLFQEIINIKPFLREASIKKFLESRSLLGKNVKNSIHTFNPVAILYIPSPIRSLVLFKSKLLKQYGGDCKLILLLLQPFSDRLLVRKSLVNFLDIDLVLVQSLKVKNELEDLGLKVKLIPSGVDIQKFTPVPIDTRKCLQKKYRLDDKFIVLHVGHINRRRNVQILKKIAEIPWIKVILVSGSAGPLKDFNLAEDMRKRGIYVITGHLPNVQEIYQLADCYVFPVEDEGASIGIPLSILEAMACNLPIITTKFGGLPVFFPENDVFLYVNKSEEIIDRIYEIRKKTNIKTREMVLPFSWSNIAKKILDDTLEMIE